MQHMAWGLYPLRRMHVGSVARKGGLVRKVGSGADIALGLPHSNTHTAACVHLQGPGMPWQAQTWVHPSEAVEGLLVGSTYCVLSQRSPV